MRLALDTNRYTDLCRGDAAVVETIELADEAWVPSLGWEHCEPDLLSVAKDRRTRLSYAVFC